MLSTDAYLPIGKYWFTAFESYFIYLSGVFGSSMLTEEQTHNQSTSNEQRDKYVHSPLVLFVNKGGVMLGGNLWKN